ncbi:MAG: hypothetical protein WD059_02100 [Balneolaceae bacterium]
MVQRVLKRVLLIMLCMLFSANIWAQFNIQHQAPIAFERDEPTQLEFTVPGLSQGEVQEATLYFRYDGDFAYQQQEIQLQSGVFSTLFVVDDKSAGSIEYYLEIKLTSDDILHYPNNVENPVQVEVVEQLEDKEEQRLEKVDFSILSPKPGSGVTPDDAIIALALFYDPADLEDGEFRLLIDNIDVTGDADTSAYYISYIPTGLRSGLHKVTLDYVTKKGSLLVTEWEFYVVQPGQASFNQFNQNYIPTGQAELAARNQVIAGDVNNAYSGRTRFSGKYGSLKYSLNSYFTTQESNRLQPQNRYGLRMELGKWWEFEAGHVYPVMSKFTISGRRVNGINTSLHLLWENLNFQFIHGELDRSIENLYSSIDVQQVTSSADSVVDTRYTLNYDNRGRGTFKRRVTGGRIGLGNEEKFQLGFHVLKVQDDTTSLFNVRNYLDLSGSPLNLGSNLGTSDHTKLQENPNLLNIEGGSVRPRDNLVAGTDLKFGFDNNRVRFESEAVISALNDDIYGGPFSVERADELGFDIEQEDVDLLEQLSWLIIINENLSTIPIRLTDDEDGNGAGFFFPTSIVAGNSELSFRYPRNNFRLQYRWIGPNFNSLANTTIRKDIAGFTFTDRVNLFSNRLYLTLGFENLQDNVVGNRDATTETKTYRTNASWYPVNRSLPRVSLGLRYRTRDNSIERYNPLVEAGFESAAVQNLRIAADGDSTVYFPTTSPKLNNTVNLTASITQQVKFLDMTHDISLNLSNMKTTDKVFAFGDVNSASASLNMTSRFSAMPMRTQLGVSYNDTESGSGLNQIKILGIYVGGNYFMLDDRLSLSGRFAITTNNASSRMLDVEYVEDIENNEVNNTQNDYYYLGDETIQPAFSTFALQAGAQYTLNEYHAFIFDANLTNVSGNNRANDRTVQFRYVFRF